MQGSSNLSLNEGTTESIEMLKNEAKRHIELLYRNTQGRVAVAHIGGQFSQRFYIPKTIINNLGNYVGKENIYISQNTFFKNSRKQEDIKNLCALYCDIDCYSKGLTKEQVLWNLRQDYYNSKIPIPNIEIDSGRGLYLIWLINPVPSKAIPLWSFIQNYIFSQLKHFGADKASMDASRILRLCGSVNSNTKSAVSIMDTHDYIYTINEIQTEYLPEIQKRKNKERKQRSKLVHLFNAYQLHYARYMDILKLVEMRKGNMYLCREKTLFLYRYYQCLYVHDTEEALQQTLELNNMFTHPLAENTVKRATKSAERAWKPDNPTYVRYRYKNETLIEFLHITDKEQKHLNTIICKTEKYHRNNTRRNEERRNDEGYTSRQESKMQNMKKIENLIENNTSIKQVEIAEKLGITKQAISKYLKEIAKFKTKKKSTEMAL